MRGNRQRPSRGLGQTPSSNTTGLSVGAGRITHKENTNYNKAGSHASVCYIPLAANIMHLLISPQLSRLTERQREIANVSSAGRTEATLKEVL
jgi:hypothetical protein